MTDKELAKESWWNDDGCSGAMSTEKIYECGFLAGLKAGKPTWHKPSEKLPADCSLVIAYDFEDSEPALFKFVTSNTWEWMPRRIACLSNEQIKRWCEIPKYTEE